jgi:hypothetical protein
MKRRLSILGSLLGLSMSLSPQLLGGDLTLYTGFQNPGKLTLDNVARETQVGSVIGLRISTGRILGFEQTIAYSPKFLESGHKAFNAQSNLLVGLPLDHITPYGTAGVGFIVTGDKHFFDSQDIGTKFTVNYGGGLKFDRLAGPVGIRIDVRGYTIPHVFDQTLNFIEGTVGVILSW